MSLHYKSEDGYFHIEETKTETVVTVKSHFGSPIYGIEHFWTLRTYNLNGKLIRYENAAEDIIDYSEKPITVLTPPKILGEDYD